MHEPDAGEGGLEGGADAPPPPPPDAAPPPPPDASAEWGGPCVDDRECNDAASCTTDRCEEGRCHFVADDSLCVDGLYCDGDEACVPGIGCRAGTPVACSDGTACTVDSCDEESHVCLHVARDADLDGDPDGNCPGGGDCDDGDPLVSSESTEICANGKDDDCDGDVDEDPGCTAPAYDDCAKPLEVEAPGSFSLSAAAATLGATPSCAAVGARTRDLVAALRVPEGDPVDVELVLSTTGGDTAIMVAAECNDAASELGCAAGGTAASGAAVARLRLRTPEQGVFFPVYLFSDSDSALTFTVDFVPPEPAPDNETCGTAATLEPGEHALVPLAGTGRDFDTRCGSPLGDLVYEFVLDEPRDVRVHAVSTDGLGVPIVSLGDAPCGPDTEELACRQGTNASLFRRGLGAGRYSVVVGATGPTDVDLVVETSAPTDSPPDDACDTAPALVPGVAADVTFADHEDEPGAGCTPGRADAVYSLSLDEPRDVLLVAGLSSSDQVSVVALDAACSAGSELAACVTADETPLRYSMPGLAKGTYRVVIESREGSPATLTAFTRPAAPSSLVPFADGCADAVEIPETGGRFLGNTANLADDLGASCDVGGTPPSPDQFLHLRLAARRRVVLDTLGSLYATIIDVREGQECPGQEVEGACSAGYSRDRAYVDVTLDAGDYWVQIDGYGGDAGAFTLDVFVADP